MNRPAAAYLDEITGVAEQWLRRCNDQPVQGIPVSQRGLRIALGGSRNVTVDDDGVISWTSTSGKFSAEPVRGDAAQ